MSKTAIQLNELSSVALTDSVITASGSSFRRTFFNDFINSLLSFLSTRSATFLSTTTLAPALTYQPAPATQSTTATLSLAQIQARILTSTPAAAITLTLPTGTALDAYTTPFANDTGFDWTVVNTSANAITIAPNTGVTITGAATVAANTSATYRFRRVSTGSYQAYRT